MLLILFNAHICLILVILLHCIYLHIFEAFVHRSLYIASLKIPCQSGLTFVKFLFIALGQHKSLLSILSTHQEKTNKIWIISKRWLPLNSRNVLKNGVEYYVEYVKKNSSSEQEVKNSLSDIFAMCKKNQYCFRF